MVAGLNPLGIGIPQCSKGDAGNDCYIRKSGIEIYYNDGLGDFMMGRLTITNANYAFKIKGQVIKVGDDISKLAAVYPDAYRKKHKVPSKQNEYQVLLHLEQVEVGISFEYDPQTNKITKILWSQSLV
jgi:hypothetical protein